MSIFDIGTFRFNRPDQQVRKEFEKNNGYKIPESSQIYQLTLTDLDLAVIHAEAQKLTTSGTLEQRVGGIIAEMIIEHLLRKMRLVIKWNKPIEPDSGLVPTLKPWEEADFILKKKDESEIGLEIKAVLQHKNHVHALLSEGNMEGDYLIPVKLLAEPELLSHVAVWGYLTRDEIMDLEIIEDEDPCPYKPCRAVSLREDINPISELWEKLKNECMSWEE